jgi:hypothetical protein
MTDWLVVRYPRGTGYGQRDALFVAKVEIAKRILTGKTASTAGGTLAQRTSANAGRFRKDRGSSSLVGTVLVCFGSTSSRTR